VTVLLLILAAGLVIGGYLAASQAMNHDSGSDRALVVSVGAFWAGVILAVVMAGGQP
jgi:hypothetical protein